MVILHSRRGKAIQDLIRYYDGDVLRTGNISQKSAKFGQLSTSLGQSFHALFGL